MPPIGLRPNATRGSGYPGPAQIIVKGEFRGLARWVTSRSAGDAQAKRIFPERPASAVRRDEDIAGGNDELGALLAAIGDEFQRHASAARDGVLADFAARIAHARKHLSPNLLAATLAAIKEQRKAALATISRNAALERAGRCEAAIRALGGKNPRRPGTKKQADNRSGNAPQP